MGRYHPSSKQTYNPSYSYGQAIVELLVAMALTAVLLPALITGVVASREGKVQQKERLTAVSRVREAREALLAIRGSGWSNVAVNGDYHPVVLNSVWALAPGSEEVNNQTRLIRIEDAYRDANGALVTQGGEIDPSTKKITISASWSALFPSSVTSVYYLTRLTNRVFSESSEVDFLKGTQTNTVVTNTSGGEVTLGAGGRGNWCEPSLTITALDLPKNGVANAISAIEGRVFAGTGDNASGVSFANVNIANTDPPTANILGTFDGYKTNGIFGESGYAYLATDNNFKEIVIINLSAPDPVTNKYPESGYFDIPGNKNATSVYVSGSIGFATEGPNLFTFDLSGKTNSRPQLGTIGLTATGTRVVVMGQYAYVSVDSNPGSIDIIQVSSDGKTLTSVGRTTLNSLGAVDIILNSTGTRAYVAAKNDAVKHEFFILDTSVKGANRPVLGTYDTAGMNPKAVSVVTNNKALIVGTGGTEYQVINIADEANPVSCGGLNVDTGVHGVTSIIEADGDAYSYIITGDSTSELKIIKGGPGGHFATSGVFESQIFDASDSAVFNRFTVNTNTPNQTSVTYQMSVANAVSGSCTNAQFTFVGPNKSLSEHFATSSAIPLGSTGNYTNPGRCFRYRAYFQTQDLFVSPILNDITVNFSP